MFTIELFWEAGTKVQFSAGGHLPFAQKLHFRLLYSSLEYLAHKEPHWRHLDGERRSVAGGKRGVQHADRVTLMMMLTSKNVPYQ